MKTKQLLVAVCVLGVIAAVVSWLPNRETAGTSHPGRAMGESLLVPEELEPVTEIHLSGAGEQGVILRKENGKWMLPDYFGLPADFEKLTRFTGSLLDNRIDRHVTSSQERLERLGLENSSVRLIGSGGEIRDLQIGRGGSAGGSFVRFDEEPSAYLTTTSIFVDANRSNWPAKQPLTFEESEVKRIEIGFDEEGLAFVRDEKGGAFSGENLAENENAKSGEVVRMLRSFVNARFIEALPVDEPDAVAAREHATPVKLTLFDGSSFTLNIGRRPGSDGGEAVPASSTKGTGTSTSIVIDQDGEIVPAELIASMEAEAATAAGQAAGDQVGAEKVEPGPVVIYYSGDAPGFVWSDLADRVALRFSDHVFNQLPSDREKLIDVVVVEEPAVEIEEPIASPEEEAGDESAQEATEELVDEVGEGQPQEEATESGDNG